MSKIKLEDFTTGVELERRKLIDVLKSKGNVIEDSASLSRVVDVFDKFVKELPNVGNKHKIRFFDCDGTQIGESIWVENGGSLTPPENPNYDSERLTFDRWASAIGNTFDNITHDVDYGALYKIKDWDSYIFFNLDESSGLNVSIALNIAQTPSLQIDWGDGNISEIITESGEFSHTYSTYGEYVIRIINIEKHESTNYSILYSIGNTSRTTILGSAKVDYNISKIYTPLFNQSYKIYSSLIGLEFFVYHIGHSSSSSDVYQNFLICHNWDWGGTFGSYGIKAMYPKRVIIDNTISASGASSVALLSQRYFTYFDKLILPKLSASYFFIGSSSGFYVIDKLISLTPFKGNQYNYYKETLYLGDRADIQPINYGMMSLYLRDIPLSIPSYFLRYSAITSFTVTDKMQCVATSFNECSLVNLYLPQNYATSLSLNLSYGLSIECLVDILNKVIDNSDSENVLTISLPKKRILNRCFVRLNNGIYELCEKTDDGAISIIEAFTNKNWTVS